MILVHLQKVVNPFHGTVYRKSDTEVLIRPIRADVLMYEIVVSGFDVDRSLDEENTGVFKRAGRQMGMAKHADCESGNFLFVAMRKKPNSTENTESKSEDSYSYIDPAPYLKRRFPKPGHQSTCNGFSYYYIGMTAEEGDMTGGADDEEEDIHRSSSDDSSKSPFGHKHGRVGRSVAEQQPAHPAWMEKFKSKFHNMTGKFDKYKNMLSKAYRYVESKKYSK